MDLTKNEVTARCKDLVYKVAYSFYDSPYIIMLRVLVNRNVVSEKQLSELLGIGPNDVRKYLGLLHVHRLVKRYVNKEKATSQWQPRPGAGGPASKTRDVIYWYIDYREFANVVKYRIAMMRRSIDAKVKNEAGNMGYVCPSCGKEYNTLDMAGMFDASAGAFFCEVCNAELMEDDPALHEDGQDRMSRFNEATKPIQDALRAIEGAQLPTQNVVAWIAQNVTTESVAAAGDGSASSRKIGVVIGEVDDSEAKRAAEEQKKQNVLPEWHLRSTVTNQKTALGIANSDKEEEVKVAEVAQQDEDDALAAHYANMDDEEEEDDDMEEAELEQLQPETGEPTPNETPAVTPAAGTPAPAASEIKVMVNGEAKLLSEVTEADEELMTPDEYEAYFEATSSVV